MPEITLSEEMYIQVAEFKQVVEAVIEEEIDFDACIELIIQQGIGSMVAGLLEPLDQATLLRSFQELGLQYPTQVYHYVAAILRKGATLQEQQQKMKRELGFSPIENSRAKNQQPPVLPAPGE